MSERKKKGFVIEMMMIFMLITFGFCILITTVILGLRNERKYSHANIQMQTDLNQIGEYYIRYVELSGEQFPTGNESSVNDFFKDREQSRIMNIIDYFRGTEKNVYNWMGVKELVSDDGKTIDANKHLPIVDFFLKANNQYTYETYYTIKRGNVFNFFTTQAIWRKLVVRSKDDGKIKLIVELTETRSDETSSIKANYKVENWSMGDDLTDETADSYVKDNFTILQKLWQLIGNILKSVNNTLSSLIRPVLDQFERSLTDFANGVNVTMQNIEDRLLETIDRVLS